MPSTKKCFGKNYHEAQERCGTCSEKVKCWKLATGNGKYDRSYCDDPKHFMDPKCKHPTTAVFDGEFYPKEEGGQQKRVKDICTRCGKIGKWSKMIYSPTGAFTPYYTSRI